MKTIGIIGARQRDAGIDFAKVRKAFWSVAKRGDMIVSGGCPEGGDRFAERIAEVDRMPIRVHYPDKTKLDSVLLAKNPRAAYAVINNARNTLIARDADYLIACVAASRKGGTEDTIKKFTKKLRPDIRLTKEREFAVIRDKKMILV